MRALITGIKGFAGSHLAEHLLGHAVEVAGVDLEGAPDDRISHILPSLRLFACDLRDRERLVDVVRRVRPDHVYHLAAQTSVQSSWENPGGTLAANIMGGLNVLEAAKAVGGRSLRILMVSSAEVYGDACNPGEAATEEWLPQPRTPYAVSKACVEWMCERLELARKLEIVLVRPFNHIGPRQDSRFVLSNFALQVAEMESRKRAPVLKVGDLSVERDFTDVRDVVSAYSLGMERGTSGEIYNVCSGKAARISDALDILLAMTDIQVTVEKDESRLRPVDVPLLQGSFEKIRRDTGWVPTIPLDKSLHDILQEWRAKVSGRPL